MPAFRFRRFGHLADIVDLHKKAAEQAYTAAEALLSGDAFEDSQMTRRLPPLKLIVPCAVTYEFLPIRWPYSEAFETSLEGVVGKPLFSGYGNILPFQILDVQQVELWDDLFELPRDTGNLLEALIRRASDRIMRYRDLPEEKRNNFRSNYIERPGVVQQMVELAEQTSQRRLREISETPQP